MKKTYTKPTISFEDFKMSTSIAGNCVFNENLSDRNSCSLEVGGFNIFSNGICDFGPQDIGADVCYDMPNDDTRVFAS